MSWHSVGPGESFPPKAPLNDASLNPLHELVYEGVWALHTRPAYRRWIWTLKDSKALLVLTSLAALLALTQTRLWILIRRAIFNQTKAIRLPATLQADPNSSISQFRAMVHMLPYIRELRLWTRSFEQHTTPSLTQELDSPVVSPWFGFFAFLNFGLFVVLGVAIPWLLTEGSLESPIVRSRHSQSCLNSTYSLTDRTLQLPKSESIFRQCFNTVNKGCDSQFYIVKPTITQRQIETCPFSNICQNGTQALEITHWNITAYELGINSKSKLSLTHRLTCSPVDIFSFMMAPQNGNISFVTVENRTTIFSNDFKFQKTLTLQLETRNGPYPTMMEESSGLWRARRGAIPDLTLLPRYLRSPKNHPWSNASLLSPLLQRKDGRGFLVVLRAGGMTHAHEIDDPFFSSHQRINEAVVADREATALGCIEQFKYCAELQKIGRYCAPWMEQNKIPQDLVQILIDTNEIYSLAELFVGFRASNHEGIYTPVEGENFLISKGSPPAMHSVYTYLGLLVEIFGVTPLRHPPVMMGIMPDLDSSTEQWIVEMELWFMKTILDSIIFIQSGALEVLSEVWEGPPGLLERFSLCDRILFRDGDYTNINWLGFWSTVLALIFICLISFSGVNHISSLLLKSLTRILSILFNLGKAMAVHSRIVLGFCWSRSLSQVDILRFWNRGLGNYFGESRLELQDTRQWLNNAGRLDRNGIPAARLRDES